MKVENKEIAKRKIAQLVYMHGVYVLNTCGLVISQSAEQSRLYADFQAGHLTLDEIASDISEYQKLNAS